MRSSEIILSLNPGAQVSSSDADRIVEPTPEVYSPTGGQEFVLRAGTIFHESDDRLCFQKVGGGRLTVPKNDVYLVYMWKTGTVLWASEEYKKRYPRKHLTPNI